jgi:hypothetical protein
MIRLQFFFLFCLTFATTAYSAQWAIVTKPKAIIYAHPDLTAPLGYIISGKKIRVGDKPRNLGTVLPVVISGRVAWIKIQDLYLEKLVSSGLVKNDSFIRGDVDLSRNKESLENNSHLSGLLGFFSPGNDWNNINFLLNDEEGGSLGFALHGRYHHWPVSAKRFNFAWGLSYFSLSGNNHALVVTAAAVEGHYTFTRRDSWEADLVATLFYSPLTGLTIDDQTSTGDTFGGSFTGEFRYKLNQDWSFISNAGLQSLTVNAPLDDASKDIFIKELKLYGWTTYFGFTYKL